MTDPDDLLAHLAPTTRRHTRAVILDDVEIGTADGYAAVFDLLHGRGIEPRAAAFLVVRAERTATAVILRTPKKGPTDAQMARTSGARRADRNPKAA